MVILIQKRHMLTGQAQEGNQVRTKRGREIQRKSNLKLMANLIILLALNPKTLIYFSITTHNKLPKKSFPTFSIARMGQIENG